jgi:hypothetical protein
MVRLSISPSSSRLMTNESSQPLYREYGDGMKKEPPTTTIQSLAPFATPLSL